MGVTARPLWRKEQMPRTGDVALTDSTLMLMIVCKLVGILVNMNWPALAPVLKMERELEPEL